MDYENVSFETLRIVRRSSTDFIRDCFGGASSKNSRTLIEQVRRQILSEHGRHALIPSWRGDLPHPGRTSLNAVESVNLENDGHECGIFQPVG
jgi:hypothetical protein